MSDVTDQVREYWNRASCGTDRTNSDKHSLEYFEEIEEFRYRHEPYIHSFAQFTRWKDQKILEIGVGAGTDFLQFIRAGADTYGVDLTEEAIDNVSKRLEIYGLSARDLRCCNAEHLPYEDGAFDLVYTWGVIHHAENMEKVFAEIYRVTRPGGSVKIMIYNLNSVWAWYLFMRHGLPKGKFLGGRQWSIYHFQESYATKAYRSRDVKRLLSNLNHTRFRIHFWNQIIRDGARFATIRKIIDRITPRRMRWYMAFEFKKPVSTN